jgi:hypothetical protein
MIDFNGADKFPGGQIENQNLLGFFPDYEQPVAANIDSQVIEPALY